MKDIPIRIESNQNSDPYPNVRSVLVEIQHGLQQFNKNGHKHIIDLGSIPIAPYERVKLLEVLGQGEVSISLSSLGQSEIYETAISGVWITKHRDEQEQISAMFVDICRIPDIVLSQMDDMDSLTEELQQLIEKL